MLEHEIIPAIRDRLTEEEFARFQSAECQDLLFTFGLEEGFKEGPSWSGEPTQV